MLLTTSKVRLAPNCTNNDTSFDSLANRIDNKLCRHWPSQVQMFSGPQRRLESHHISYLPTQFDMPYKMLPTLLEYLH